MNSYEHNLSALKRLIDKYIIADLTTMIDSAGLIRGLLLPGSSNSYIIDGALGKYVGTI